MTINGTDKKVKFIPLDEVLKEFREKEMRNIFGWTYPWQMAGKIVTEDIECEVLETKINEK